MKLRHPFLYAIDFQNIMSLRTSGAPRSESKITMTASGSHTLMQRRLVWPLPGIPSGHNPFPCLPLGEGVSRVPRKRETDEGKKLSVKACACDHPLHKYFGPGSSGGNVLVPARTLIRSRLKGRCRKAAPLRIPRPHRRACLRMFQVAMGGSIEELWIECRFCNMLSGMT